MVAGRNGFFLSLYALKERFAAPKLVARNNVEPNGARLTHGHVLRYRIIENTQLRSAFAQRLFLGLEPSHLNAWSRTTTTTAHHETRQRVMRWAPFRIGMGARHADNERHYSCLTQLAPLSKAGRSNRRDLSDIALVEFKEWAANVTGRNRTVPPWWFILLMCHLFCCCGGRIPHLGCGYCLSRSARILLGRLHCPRPPKTLPLFFLHSLSFFSSEILTKGFD